MDNAAYDGIDTLTIDITSEVRKWMVFKDSNYGLLLIGPEQKWEMELPLGSGHMIPSHPTNNNKQYTIYDDIVLKIEFIEQDK